jgi:hypothetical protein
MANVSLPCGVPEVEFGNSLNRAPKYGLFSMNYEKFR